MSDRKIRGLRDNRGLTLPEMLVGLAISGIALAISFGVFSQYQRSLATSRAARIISQDILLTRSLAIRERASISLVADETQRSYVVRDAGGRLFHRRTFGVNAEIQLSGLDVTTVGDSLTFDGRGILTSTGTPSVSAVKDDKIRIVTMNALGRSKVN